MSHAEPDAAEKQVQMWKMKKLIKSLATARGNGTSMISLIIPPGDQVSRVRTMLTEEYGTAQNIKSRVNRLSVLGAITQAQNRLKLYNRVPTNGLAVFVGEVVTEEGKQRTLRVDFEPNKPLGTSLYMCDSRFHVEALSELLQDDDKFGFIVMDGNGCLYGTLCGSHRDVLHRFSVELPKKHGRGGQSALRFARLRLEKRHNYVRKVAELATQFFITNDRPNVAGIVLAGSAEFKSQLFTSDLFDNRLSTIVIKTVDVAYGGENGFAQAIELSAETLSNVRFVQEKRLLGSYMDEVAQDTGKFAFGVRDTMTALEMSAVETLIVFENLEVTRYTVRNTATNEESVLHLSPEEAQDQNRFHDPETGVELEVVSSELLLEYFSENYRTFGARLEFVSDRSAEGSQFCRGFGGIGAILRWRVDFVELEMNMQAGGDLDGPDDDDLDEWGL